MLLLRAPLVAIGAQKIMPNHFLDIQYEEMKAKLELCIQEAPSEEVEEPEVLQRYFAKFEEAFFNFCEKGQY